jgi:glycosyltransferase involved in cell wall biosynthesis
VLSEGCGLESIEQAGVGCIVGHDRGAIAAAIERFALDKSNRETVRRNARRFAETHFAWEKVVERIDRIMRDTVSDSRAEAS